MSLDSCSVSSETDEKVRDLDKQNLQECERTTNVLAEMQLKVRAAIDSDDKMAKYNHVMDSYGWKAEIPGDPFSLK